MEDKSKGAGVIYKDGKIILPDGKSMKLILKSAWKIRCLKL